MEYRLVEGKTKGKVGRSLQASWCNRVPKRPFRQGVSSGASVCRRGYQCTAYGLLRIPEYKQLFPPFVHEVSIIGLVFNEGLEAKKYMKTL